MTVTERSAAGETRAEAAKRRSGRRGGARQGLPCDDGDGRGGAGLVHRFRPLCLDRRIPRILGFGIVRAGLCRGLLHIGRVVRHRILRRDRLLGWRRARLGMFRRGRRGGRQCIRRCVQRGLIGRGLIGRGLISFGLVGRGANTVAERGKERLGIQAQFGRQAVDDMLRERGQDQAQQFGITFLDRRVEERALRGGESGTGLRGEIAVATIRRSRETERRGLAPEAAEPPREPAGPG